MMSLLRRRRTAAPDGADAEPSEPRPFGLVAPGQIGSRVRDADRIKRKPLDLWDRVKFLVLLGVLFGAFFLQNLGDSPIRSANDAFYDTVEQHRWVAVLMVLEVVRQLHFLVAEHWSGYYLFWKRRVFGGFAKVSGGMDPWVRYRVARAIKVVVFFAVVALILGNLYDQAPIEALVGLPARIWGWLPWFARLAFGFMFVAVQFLGIFWLLSRGGVETYYPEDIDTRFSDVWGQDHVVERVKENLIFLENPDAIEERGGYTPGGIMLWGPPGTGKTLIAEAAAGETGKPFVFVEPGAFINMFFGIGIIKVKTLYRKLRKLALRYDGVVVFFDEADSLGSRGGAAMPTGQFMGRSGPDPYDVDHLRWLSPQSAEVVARDRFGWGDPLAGTDDRIIMGAGMGGGGGMGTLQALLTEMSGLKKPRGFFNRTVRKALGMRPKPPPRYRILHMMATNMPDVLDPALMRPGRLDRIYRVGYPSREGRIRTFRGYLDKVSNDLSDDEVEKLATISPYATGATIKDIVNEALIIAIRENREVITWNDLVRAKRLKRLGPPEDVEYIERERHAVAVHEACHAVAAVTTRKHLTIDIATIEKGGTYLGMVSSVDPDDRYTQWRSEYESDIIVALASLAGERYFYSDDNSSGVSGDLVSATTVAAMMIGYWGMGETIASHRVQRELQTGGGGQPNPPPRPADQQQRLRESLGDQIEKKLAMMLKRAETLLARHRGEVLAIAHALESNRTISGDDINAIMLRTRGPLFDGAAYMTPEAQATLEEYHAEATLAHKENRPTLMELPVIPGLHPEDAVEVSEAPSLDEAALIGAVASEDSAPTG
jgi:cell division protease FtsH